jgi:NAD(P)H-dependent FMN reductase
VTKLEGNMTISIIIGSTRQGRFSEKPAQWGGDVDKGLAELDKQANVMIDDLTWWTAALKAARER